MGIDRLRWRNLKTLASSLPDLLPTACKDEKSSHLIEDRLILHDGTATKLSVNQKELCDFLAYL